MEKEKTIEEITIDTPLHLCKSDYFEVREYSDGSFGIEGWGWEDPVYLDDINYCPICGKKASK